MQNFYTPEMRTEMSRKIAQEGIVLLKNEDKVLPLKNQKIAVFGRGQIDSMHLDDVTLIDALKAQNVEFDSELSDVYAEWIEKNQIRKYGNWLNDQVHNYPEMPISREIVEKTKANGCDVAVVSIGRRSCENSDTLIEKGDYYLSETEEEMLENISAVYENVVLLANIACGFDFSISDKYNIKAVLFVGHLGFCGNDTVVDILFGKVNPSGKITLAYAKDIYDYASTENFGQHKGGIIQDYVEDIFIGYRYFDTFEKNDRVIYPFGHGLSYTEFSVTDTTCVIDDKVTVTAKVTNIGDTYAGKETLQLYFSAPQVKDGAKLSKPTKELRQFAKTKLLVPGESEVITISFDTNQMASFDDTGVLGEDNVWVMEKGEYKILLGTSSANVKEVGSLTLEDHKITERCHKLLTTLPKRLLADGSYEKLSTKPFDPKKGTSVVMIGVSEIPVTDNSDEYRAPDCFCKGEVGKTYTYKLNASYGGGHVITIGEKSDELLTDYFDVKFNDVPLELEGVKLGEGFEVTFRLGTSILELTLKKQIAVKSFFVQKTEKTAKILPEGENHIHAKDAYECSMDVNFSNFQTADGSSGSALANFWRSGMYVLFRVDVEEAGLYDFSMNYAANFNARPLNEAMALFITNIVEPLSDAEIEKTWGEGVSEKRVFKYTNPVGIYLPKGISYIKLAVESTPFPEIAEIVLTHNENAVTFENTIAEDVAEKNRNYKVELLPTLNNVECEKIGIQFEEVYRNPELMKPFLEQLSNKELATVVSGTSLNRILHGNVGCNHPLPERGVPPCQTADGGTLLYLRPPIYLQKYPDGMILASTFNHEIFKEFGYSIASEALDLEVDIWLSPSINLFRNPCGGRNNSYFSEDPYLAGLTASDIINAVQSMGVATMLKHYAANTSEFERLKSNSRVSIKALRELYIKGFEIAVKNASPWSIMSSYNYINDVKVCEDYDLITTIPRDEWNWDGIFATDWWNSSNHTRELLAGHDLKMATGDITGVTKSLDDGVLTREQVMVCAERILKYIMKIKRIKDELDGNTK